MLTLSLDEAGRFDTGTKWVSYDSETTLIGGVLFDDCDKEDEAVREKKRIEAYYRAVVDSVNTESPNDRVRFPEDLHSKGKNNNIVKLIKKKISDTMKEFLQTGTYEGKKLSIDGQELDKREGKYYICAIVKSEAGKEALLRNELGDFFRDGVASNIYFHMASEAVEHLIFHNPLFPKADNFSLDIATRQSAIIEKAKSDDYLAQGMTANDRTDLGEDEKQFSLMDADVFRTILTEQMMNDKSKDIVISSFNVRPISYYKKKDYDKQIFLYFADSVCSLLTYGIGKNDVEGVINKARDLTDNSLVFLYDETDEYFKRAWRAVESGEYCKALRETFKLKNKPSYEAKLYKESWIPFIERSIKEHIAEEKEINDMSSVFYSEVQKLRNTYMTNILNSEEALYTFKVFEEASEMIDDNKKSDMLMYYLNDIGVKAYCHMGDTASVEPYYRNCEELAYTVGIEEYIRTRNQYATALCDAFDYEKAVCITKGTVTLAKGVYELSRKLRGKADEEHFGKTEFAKTLSLAGQFASFMKDNETGLIWYDDALEFMKNDRVNTKITESYKLHLLIQSGDKERYEKTMTDYCDGDPEAKSQLVTIKRMADNREVNERYALFIYIKGLYYFKQNQEISEVYDDLQKYIEDIPVERKLGHPWELIYKYLGLLSVKINKHNVAKDCIKWIDKVSEGKEDTLIYVISLESKAQLYDALGNTNEAEQLYKESYLILRDKYQIFYDEADLCNLEDMKNKVNDKLSYMYY